jgi:hypothetical protein
MDLAAASGNTGETAVKVSCLNCNGLFDGIKRFKGRRGRFEVKSRGLTLHFRSNSCDGPCVRYYTGHKMSLVEFSSSLLLVGGQQATATPRLSPLSMPHYEDCSEHDAEEQNYPSVDLPSPSSKKATSFSPLILDFDNGKTMISPGARLSSKPSCTSHTLNHKQLDTLFFHQMLEPYVPGPAALKPPSYSALASLLLPQARKSPSLADGVDADVLSFAEEDDEEEDDEEEDEESSTGSASGSYQSLEDGEGDDVADAGLGHPPNAGGSNWMVAKRQDFVLRESREPPPTPQLQSEVRLLKLLCQHKAPLRLYPLIHQWARESLQVGHDFSRPIRPRARVLSELEQRFDMQSSRFTPTIVSYLPDERPTVVYIASFADAVYSLLSDPELMKEENLSFPDAHHPFFLEPPADPNRRAPRKPDLSELHHGTWHKDTSRARCTAPNDVLAGVIGYMDGVATDAFGRLGLCPWNFTLAIFNSATRARKEAWVTIYYHPDDQAEASLHKNPTTSFDKCQNLHRGLHAMFAEFREITKAGGLRWDNLKYGGTVHQVNFKFALAFVVGDTEMHDKLCGKTLNRCMTAQCLCRHCDTPLEESINPNHPRRLFRKAVFERENLANNTAYFQSVSHHPQLMNAFHFIDMGENVHNIHLASPGELLHMHQKGMMVRWVEGLSNLITGQHAPDESDDVARNIKRSLLSINTLALHYGALLSRGSDRDFPRTKFKNSLFSGTKKAAHEQAGVLLDLLVALNSDRGRQILEYERTLDPRYVADQITMCELCLGLQQWMKKPSFTRAELKKIPEAMACVITFQESVTKRGGMGTLLVKNHLCFHLFDYLKAWGPLRQMNSGPSESHHKTEVKAPSMNTQRRPATFIQQVSTRYVEIRVMRKAFQHLGMSDQQVMDDRPPSSQPVDIPVTGARCSLGLINEVPSMKWDSKSHDHRAFIHPAVIQLVCNVVLPLVPPLDLRKPACVSCYTEYKKWDGTRHTIWRAHPCYRSKESHPKDVWYDWSWFHLEDDIRVPCQILCFMDLSTMPARKMTEPIPMHRQYQIDEPTQYAVVRKFKDPPVSTDSAFLDWGELGEGFYIFPCHSMGFPVCVVPNMPMIPWDESRGAKKKRDRKERERQDKLFPAIGGYFVVLPMTEWADWFTDSVVFCDLDDDNE